MEEILSLNDNRAVGLDNIPALCMKIGRHVIASYVIFSVYSMMTFIPIIVKYQELFQSTKMITEAHNYCPISIPTCFCKINENLTYARFMYLVFTSHAILNVVTTFLENIFSGLLLIDLRRAFVNFSHQNFLIKLDIMDYNLVNSYLHDRKTICRFTLSQTSVIVDKMQYGVSQGSSLGPLFLLAYIDGQNSAVNCSSTLFADVTFLMARAPCDLILQEEMTIDLSKLHERSCVNKLTINPSKTNALLFPSNSKLADASQILVNFHE